MDSMNTYLEEYMRSVIRLDSCKQYYNIILEKYSVINVEYLIVKNRNKSEYSLIKDISVSIGLSDYIKSRWVSEKKKLEYIINHHPEISFLYNIANYIKMMDDRTIPNNKLTIKYYLEYVLYKLEYIILKLAQSLKLRQ